MQSTDILDVMKRDHNRLLKKLKNVEHNLGNDLKVILDVFNTFEWSLEKHFFVEERAVFSYYDPDSFENGYQLFTMLSKQHTLILERVEELRKRVQMEKTIDVSMLKEKLQDHAKYEEKNVYPLLDLKIAEGEKQFMIERINDVKI